MEYSVRPPTPADVPAMLQLTNAALAQDGLGRQTDAAAIEAMWQQPDINAALDRWMVCTRDGKTVGYGGLNANPPYTRCSILLYIDPASDRQLVMPILLKKAESRLREKLANDSKFDLGYLHIQIDAADTDSVNTVQNAGYAVVRQFLTMCVSLDALPAEAEPIDGVAIRPLHPTGDTEQLVAVNNAAMQDHWGGGEEDIEVVQHFINTGIIVAGASMVAESDGQMIGVSVNQFKGPALGWIRSLGVLRDWRRKGVAMALLRASFRAMFCAGKTTIGLSVDAENLTGAVHLYERAGMHIAITNNLYTKSVSLEGGDVYA